MKKSTRNNVHISSDPKAQTITIVLSTDPEKVDFQPSSSGKSMVIATTGGAYPIDGMQLNLTLYRKA